MQAPTVAAAPANIVCIASDDDDVDTKHSDANWTFNNPLVASGSPSTVLGSIRLDDVLQLDSNEVSVSQVCCYACLIVGKVNSTTSDVRYL